MTKSLSCVSPCQEEGLKLTFSKQALMPNGSAGESSSRKRRKDQEVHIITCFCDVQEGLGRKTALDLV